MGQILVRKINDSTIERLRLLASERKMPVEALAREALEEAASRRTVEEVRDGLRRLEELRQMSPPSNVDSVKLLRALREGDDSDD